MTIQGGYESGYQKCPCFWGDKPGSLLTRLGSMVIFKGKRVLDAGCGEGKNAAYLANQDCTVDAVDVSELAIAHGKAHWGEQRRIHWVVSDVQSFIDSSDRQFDQYDLVIAYGLFHCLPDAAAIKRTVDRMRGLTKPLGYHVVCAFNSRKQDGLPPIFRTLLIVLRAISEVSDGTQEIYGGVQA